MRKQTIEGRVTTVEAIGHFFRELGESEAAQEALWENLKTRIERMDAQTNREGNIKGVKKKDRLKATQTESSAIGVENQCEESKQS